MLQTRTYFHIELVISEPLHACNPLTNSAQVSGNVVLIERGFVITYLLLIYVTTKFQYPLWLVVGGVAQLYNVGLWPANFPCPALDLQLMGDH